MPTAESPGIFFFTFQTSFVIPRFLYAKHRGRSFTPEPPKHALNANYLLRKRWRVRARVPLTEGGLTIIGACM